LRNCIAIAVNGEDYRGARLNIYDVSGRRVFHAVCKGIPWLGVWTHVSDDGGRFRPGVYVLRIADGERVARSEAVLVGE
jgi:hypothetical protein